MRDKRGRQAQTKLEPALSHLQRCGATGAVLYMFSGVRKNWKYKNPKGHRVTLGCNDRSAARAFCEAIGLAYGVRRLQLYIQEGERDFDNFYVITTPSALFTMILRRQCEDMRLR